VNTDDSNPMQSLAQAFAKIVEISGYIATVNDGNDVAFRVQGTQYILETKDDDTNYVRYLLGYRMGDDISYERALAVANDVNIRLKAVKTTVYSGKLASDGAPFVRFAVEAFLDEPGHQSAMFERTLSVLSSAAEKFFAEARESSDEKNSDV
jgi:hypothetical protein